LAIHPARSGFTLTLALAAVAVALVGLSGCLGLDEVIVGAAVVDAGARADEDDDQCE
jgi:hypothetical protein